MPGSALPGRREPPGRTTTRLPSFRRHAQIFLAAAAALIALNLAVGDGWWTFWPLAAWSVLFGVHYLAHKARTVDEAWVEERTDDVRSKSYDAGHIDAIKKDPPREAPPPKR